MSESRHGVEGLFETWQSVNSEVACPMPSDDSQRPGLQAQRLSARS